MSLLPARKWRLVTQCVGLACLTGNLKVSGSNPSQFYLQFAKKLVHENSTWPIAILAIYRFDAIFDTEPALPDRSQLFETFVLQNCQENSRVLKLSKGMFTLFW